ncbi:hypothetical protein [Stagnihabitans tardus]|uniref:2-keto-4-pentenoate hydratase n=1 Tax=Stagnihabitans tardus TaxID=2699202 RepID=A0AAE4Y703_9RHOB|nr:hypothetical protein [Stagnihabitans tardus]NBZ86312.1 hypothetical protein [Stagnihabitans tardus]
MSDAARLLAQAERGPWLADLPEALAPLTEAEAYAIQMAGVGQIAGWKTGAVPGPRPPTHGAIGAARVLTGALPAHLAPAEVEVEIALILARDLPARAAPYDEAEVLAALGPAHAALELVRSRFVNRKAVSGLTALADGLSCGGVVIGSGTEAWRDLAFEELSVTLAGQAPLAEVRGPATRQQTVTALTVLANHAARLGVGMRAGQFVITGARIGPLVLEPGQELVATVENIGEVRLAI